MNRVAVQLGAAWVRVAVRDPRPRLLAALPVRDADPAEVLRTGLAALLPRPVDDLVVVHAAGAPAVVPPGTVSVVRAVPAAVAALCGLPDGLSDAVVVDVGHSGSEIVRVSRGRVVAACRVPVGGAVLDQATAELLDRAAGTHRDERCRRPVTRRAEIRAVREALSLQPLVRLDAVDLPADVLRRALAPHLARVVDGVHAVSDGLGPGRSPPVLLVGGVARTPLLAELLDAAGVGDVRVAPAPDTAAVTGALRLPPAPTGPPPAAHRPGPPPPVTSSDEVAGAYWLPPVLPRRHRTLRGTAAVAATAAALTGLYVAGTALPAPDPTPLAGTGELVQYGYAARLPDGWAHTGGLPERRRSLLTPVGAPDGANLISVERTPLGYDADTEPQRARAELRAEFDRAVSGGAPLSGFDDEARFAGRPVVGYREAAGVAAGGAAADAGDAAAAPRADAAQVDWYVVLDGDAQLSVGCRHTAAGASAVGAACATVVGSLRRIP